MKISEAFEYLGLPVSASKEQIKGRYKDLAKRCHPDSGGSELMMKLLNEAYEVAMGDQAERGNRTPPPPPPPPPQPPQSSPQPSPKASSKSESTKDYGFRGLLIVSLLIFGFVVFIVAISPKSSEPPTTTSSSPIPTSTPSVTPTTDPSLDKPIKLIFTMSLTDGDNWVNIPIVDQRCEGEGDKQKCTYFPYCIRPTIYSGSSSGGENYNFEKVATKEGGMIYRVCYPRFTIYENNRKVITKFSKQVINDTKDFCKINKCF